MRIYQARREKLKGPVSSLPAALAGVTQVVQPLGRGVGSGGRALTVQMHHPEHCCFHSCRKKTG